MIELENIHSLSEFQRTAGSYIARLKASGKPAVLTLNGEAALVVQSAKAYQRLLEEQALLERIRAISRRLGQSKRGFGKPVREFPETRQQGVGAP